MLIARNVLAAAFLTIAVSAAGSTIPGAAIGGSIARDANHPVQGRTSRAEVSRSSMLSILDQSWVLDTASSLLSTAVETTKICYFDMRGQFTISDTCILGEFLENCGEGSCEMCEANAKGECTATEGDFALYYVKKPEDMSACPASFPND